MRYLLAQCGRIFLFQGRRNMPMANQRPEQEGQVDPLRSCDRGRPALGWPPAFLARCDRQVPRFSIGRVMESSDPGHIHLPCTVALASAAPLLEPRCCVGRTGGRITGRRTTACSGVPVAQPLFGELAVTSMLSTIGLRVASTKRLSRILPRHNRGCCGDLVL